MQPLPPALKRRDPPNPWRSDGHPGGGSTRAAARPRFLASTQQMPVARKAGSAKWIARAASGQDQYIDHAIPFKK
jgi:hypothetical protein